jgi:hypothetical protein
MRLKNWYTGAELRFVSLCCCLLLLAAGCSGRQLRPTAVVPASPAAAVAAWQRLVRLETFTARAIVRLTAVDGTQNVSRALVAGCYPSQLELRWLTPWQTVAWRLLLVEREFWLTDTAHALTWHGFAAADDTAAVAAVDGGNGFLTYVDLLADWALLFSPPDGTPRLQGAVAERSAGERMRTSFLVDADGLPAGKIIRFADGREWHVIYDRLIETPAGYFPEQLTLRWRGGSLEISWSALRFNLPLDRDRFQYRGGGSLELREVMDSGKAKD